MSEIRSLALACKDAAQAMFGLDSESKRRLLHDMAAALETQREAILAANARDLQQATAKGIQGATLDRLQAQGDYSESYFTHGLSVETAEALAEYVHQLFRTELGLEKNQGKRYSWGYPACPDLADHGKVMRLLDAEAAIGVRVTSAYQLVPEQSTAAIATHHPDAKYFYVISRLAPEAVTV